MLRIHPFLAAFVFTGAIAALTTDLPAAPLVEDPAEPSEQIMSASATAHFVGLTPTTFVLSEVSTETADLILAELDNDLAQRVQLSQLIKHREVLMAELIDPGSSDNDGNFAVPSSPEAIDSMISELSQSIDGLVDGILESAAATLPEATMEVMQQFNTTAGKRIPRHFRLLQLDDDDWAEVEKAFVQWQRSLRTGQPLEQDLQLILDDVSSTPIVHYAEQLLNAHFDAMSAVFASYADVSVD
ncbi:MAG: hypothetical protein EA377_04235 [Phycisphaerales bacterium]|nr:MAG: hypothetical protein EA377_04235 [Phycisphaerales bacterium]